MKLHTLTLTLAIAAAVSLSTSTVFAAPITGLFNTGVDNSNIPLAAGLPDTHYTLGPAPSGGPNPIVQNSLPGSWVPNTSNSQWVGPVTNAGSSQPGGIYDYNLTFSLAGLDASTAAVTGAFASDNSSTIFLNGVSTGITHSGGAVAFTAFDPFVINTGFVPGVNTLTFRVNNGSGPTGLHVDALRGKADPIPEPASLVLFSFGIGAIALRRARQS